MPFDPTVRMNRIRTEQAAANAERLALIADTAEEEGHGREGVLKVYWSRGAHSGLPVSEALILIRPDGRETVLGTALPEPAQQELLSLLEQQFDPSRHDGSVSFTLNAGDTPGQVTQEDLDLLAGLQSLLEEQEDHEAATTLSPVQRDRSTALRALTGRLELFRITLQKR